MRGKILCYIIMMLGMWFDVMAAPLDFTVAYEDKEQPPYYFGYSTKIPTNPGIAVEIVKGLQKRIPDLQLNLVRYPWKRGLFLLEKGKIDALFKATYKPERLKLGAYPMKNGKIDVGRKIAMMSNSLYKLKESSIDWNGKSFVNLKGNVCVPRGYAIANTLKQKGVFVVESDGSLSCLQKLRLARVEAIALQDVTGDALLRKSPKQFKDIIKVAPPLTTKPQYLMLSNQFVDKHPELAEKIWDTIATIRREELDRISEKYAE